MESMCVDVGFNWSLYFTHTGNGEHGRTETRKIWVTTKLNHYLNFPYVRQAFMIERQSIRKKTGRSVDKLLMASLAHRWIMQSQNRFFGTTGGHWSIESCHYIIDWNCGEDRSQIRTGFGPENITRLRRFAIGLLKDRSAMKRSLKWWKNWCWIPEAVFDYLKMTRNSNPGSIG